MLKNLSNLGMGKRDTMQEIVEQEAEQFSESWRNKKGKSIHSRVKLIII